MRTKPLLPQPFSRPRHLPRLSPKREGTYNHDTKTDTKSSHTDDMLYLNLLIPVVPRKPHSKPLPLVHHMLLLRVCLHPAFPTA